MQFYTEAQREDRNTRRARLMGLEPGGQHGAAEIRTGRGGKASLGSRLCLCRGGLRPPLTPGEGLSRPLLPAPAEIGRPTEPKTCR